MKLTRAILFDVLIGACIYGWRVEGMHSAKVFLECWLWFSIAMLWIFALFAEKKHLYARSTVCVIYDIASSLILTAVLVWLSETTLAVLLFIGWVLTSAKLEGYKEPGDAGRIKETP